MTGIIKTFYKTEHRIGDAAGRFLIYHPYIGFAAAIIGMSIAIIAAVAVITTVVTVPIAVIFGWL